MNIWQQVMMNQPDMEGMGPLNNEAFLSQQTSQRAPANYRPAPPPPMPQLPKREPAQAPRRNPNADSLEALRGEQEEGVQSLEDIARQYAEYVNQKKGQTDLSPLLQLSDSLFGSNIAKGYDAPPTEEEVLGKKAALQKEINAARAPMATELLKQYASDNSVQSKALRQLAQQSGQSTKQANKLADNVMFRRGVAPQVRVPIMTLNRVNAANTIIDNVLKDQKGLVDPNELKEMGASVAQVVLNSNDITDEKFKAFVVDNVKTQVADLSQYIFSKPKGIDQKEWLMRYKKTLKREQAVAKQALKSYQGAEYKIAEGLGMDPRQIEAVKAGGDYWLDSGYPDVQELGGGPVEVYNSAGEMKMVNPENLGKAAEAGYKPK